MTEAPLVPLRRNRDFVLLWSGQAVSTVGSRVSSLAFPLLVLAATGSPVRAGVVGFAQTVPFLVLYLPAGALVDRLDRKHVMLWADGGRACALASLVAALALGRFWLAHVVAVAVVEGSLFVFFQLAETAALPQVVAKEQLPTAMAQNQARVQGADLVGTPLGGVLFGLGRMVPFLFDAVSYAVSFATLVLIRPPFQERRERATTRLRADVAEGIGWLWGQPFLRTCIALIAGSNFAFNGLTLVLIVRAKDLGASSALVGAMFALVGGGAILGSVAAPWLQRRVPPAAVVIGSLWLWALLGLGLALPREPLAIGAVLGVTSLTGPGFNVVLGSYRYALVPDRLLGRVQSAALVVGWGAIPLGMLSAGVLVDRLGARESIVVLGGVMVGVALAASASGNVRRAPRIEALLAARPAASPGPAD